MHFLVFLPSFSPFFFLSRLLFFAFCFFSSTTEETPPLQLLIPTAITGAVIGKHGSYVKTIQEKSLADCQFHRAERSDHTRLITIRGTVDQCIRAQKLIAMKISEVSALLFEGSQCRFVSKKACLLHLFCRSLYFRSVINLAWTRTRQLPSP